MFKQTDNKIESDLILKHLPVAMGVSTLSGELLASNALMHEWFGDKRGSSAQGLYVRPEDRTAWIKRLQRDGQIVNHVLELRKKDGQPAQFLVNARLIHYNSNNLILVVVTEYNPLTQPQTNGIKAGLDSVDTLIETLLERLSRDKKQVEENILASVEKTILPLLITLGNTSLTETQHQLLKILQASLADIVSPFASTIGQNHTQLTPMEMQVANLIRTGATSKQIAGMLGLSYRTIEAHRNNIRRKLGLKGKKANLASFLVTPPNTYET
ncbi:helix-turn-helix transcriptional regulator [Desulfosudis oleivorans]|uniref:Transcriptional regulator, LuxR family n=1 Tax=Desulfosudis oleivorans (strain DSM 6200 / JCM 39069 / Hxd3) TaxID=96561 RepID=A8ZUE5_DESOH|nr:helix-turn-helix transcriptional regulator [Desulfosudis oleivorans]ABW67977.1 transcriptional regulator, LuxR family [Desulfosudis oleivorans Hxd3]